MQLVVTSSPTAKRSGRISLPFQMAIGLVLGLMIGILFPRLGASLQPLGTAFIEAIRMIVIPLVFSAVTLGIYKMGADVRLLGRVGLISFGWFYFATVIFAVIALALDAIFKPGVGVDLVPSGSIPPNLAHFRRLG